MNNNNKHHFISHRSAKIKKINIKTLINTVPHVCRCVRLEQSSHADDIYGLEKKCDEAYSRHAWDAFKILLRCRLIPIIYRRCWSNRTTRQKMFIVSFSTRYAASFILIIIDYIGVLLAWYTWYRTLALANMRALIKTSRKLRFS